MRHFFVLFALGLMGLGLAAGAAAPAAGQAGNTPLPTEAPTTEANDTEGPEIVAHDFDRQLDRDVTIRSWSYHPEAEEFRIHLEVYNRTSVSITEALSLESKGDARINVFDRYLSPGSHQINFTARPGASDEAAAVLSTRRSFQQGRAVIISTGYVPEELPFAQTDSVTGWFGGFATLLSMVVLAGIQRIRNAKDAPVEVR